MAGSSLETCEVFGVDVFHGNVDAAARKVVERTRAGGGYVCLCNVHVLMTAQRDAALGAALRDAWMVLPDGAPIAWLQRRLDAAEARRVAGADLMTRVLAIGQTEKLRHYLFGSTDGALARLTERLEARFPGAVVGASAPPFDSFGKLRPPDGVAASRPDVVWCSLGAPKQELWMQQFAHELRPAVVVGVGAAFDFLAGTKTRAPEWMQRASLEWLHRLASEPRRLGPRYIRTNGEFVARALRALARGGR